MNTLVSLEIDRLLLQKGIDMPVSPTIADVVMWLYEKHKIWIYVTIFQTETQFYCQSWIEIPYKETICLKTGKISHTPSAFNSPAEAYEAAIKYTLKNLI